MYTFVFFFFKSLLEFKNLYLWLSTIHLFLCQTFRESLFSSREYSDLTSICRAYVLWTGLHYRFEGNIKGNKGHAFLGVTIEQRICTYIQITQMVSALGVIINNMLWEGHWLVLIEGIWKSISWKRRDLNQAVKDGQNVGKGLQVVCGGIISWRKQLHN